MGTAELAFADRQFGDREWPTAQSNGSIQAKGYGSIQPQGSGKDVFGTSLLSSTLD
jgi:hypothetical protein